MADDQNQKASTIDNLVKELSKSNTNQPPSNLPGVKIESKVPPIQSEQSLVTESRILDLPSEQDNLGQIGKISSVPPVSSVSPMRPTSFSPPAGPPVQTSGPKPVTSPLPQPPSMIKPVTPQPVPKPVLPVQEYRSSIRTMSEDVASIQSGQKPLGVDIPRKISPEIPKTELSPQPIPPPPKPSPSPQVKVSLGDTEKSAPLPSAPIPKLSVLAPLKPAMPKPPGIQPPIVAPPTEKWFLNPKLLVLIAGILVVGGFLYWFLVLRIAEPEIVVSPTPSPTLTPTPSVQSLSEIFKDSPVNFEVSLSENVSEDFKIFIGTLSIPKNAFSRVDLVVNIEDNLVPTNFLSMWDVSPEVYPPSLKNNILITDSVVLVYGQSETFREDGSIDLTVQDLKKTVFVIRAKDKIAIKAIMREWELTIAQDLADYLLINNTSKETDVNFLDNMYRSASIRYKNFPFPDVTVDYAVVDVGAQSYLVISGSRESMYEAIDTLLEQ